MLAIISGLEKVQGQTKRRYSTPERFEAKTLFELES
jgi:hypothetical protein